MHSDLVRWLLDLDVIPPGAEGVRWAWAHPWPKWLWALLLVGAALFAAQSYRRLVGARMGRGALAATRTIVIVLLLLIISGPMLELPRETVERDWVIVLVDRSASLTITDAEGTDGRASRDEQLRSLLQLHAPMWDELAAERQLVWVGFHADLGSSTRVISSRATW